MRPPIRAWRPPSGAHIRRNIGGRGKIGNFPRFCPEFSAAPSAPPKNPFFNTKSEITGGKNPHLPPPFLQRNIFWFPLFRNMESTRKVTPLTKNITCHVRPSFEQRESARARYSLVSELVRMFLCTLEREWQAQKKTPLYIF